MSAGTYGRLSVDFAGTRAEARELARKHNMSVGSKPGADDGCVQITAIYTNPGAKSMLYSIFAELGWDAEFVSDHSYLK